MDGDVDITFYEGLSREHWVAFDVVILNNNGAQVADGFCIKYGPHGYINVKPFDEKDVGVCILNFLLPINVEVFLVLMASSTSSPR